MFHDANPSAPHDADIVDEKNEKIKPFVSRCRRDIMYHQLCMSTFAWRGAY